MQNYRRASFAIFNKNRQFIHSSVILSEFSALIVDGELAHYTTEKRYQDQLELPLAIQVKQYIDFYKIDVELVELVEDFLLTVFHSLNLDYHRKVFRIEFYTYDGNKSTFSIRVYDSQEEQILCSSSSMLWEGL